MPEEPKFGGYEKPQQIESDYIAQLYEEEGLGQSPSQEDIEPVAKKYLKNHQEFRKGASLVLGREISDEEWRNEIMGFMIVFGGDSKSEDADNRYSRLLLYKAGDDLKKGN